ncbi:MAG TPA: DUF1835 domain-containing protein [Pyrinomonadaceae bacterium]|jgi:hypothetical protein
MSIHVLPGDSLVESFKKTNIEGEIVVCRECLIDGDVGGEELEDFWRARANFINLYYGEDEYSYMENVAAELEKLIYTPPQTQINLWFEYELFCQANMWFCLYLMERYLSELSMPDEEAVEIYRVAPVVRGEDEIWKGFGRLESEDLQKCFEQRIKFGEADILLGKDLWESYRKKDFDKLRRLSLTGSECFPKLKEVCEAEIEKQFRPKETLRKIVSGGESDFVKIFEKFAAEEGVYGFGDLQVQRLLQEI